MPGVINQSKTSDSTGHPRRRVSKSDGPNNGVMPAQRLRTGPGFESTAPNPSTFWSPTSDSYHPPYPQQTTSTAYGLNEPQWSFGPPPIVYERSPYVRVPLSPMAAPGFPISIHPLLTVGNHGASGQANINWCVNRPASDAQLSSSSGGSAPVAYHWKAMPAINPTSTPSLTIRIPYASRPVVVFPSNSHSGVITIGDVLNAVYAGLRQCANDVLCESMGLSPMLLSSQIHSMGYPQIVTQSSSGLFTGDDEVSTHVAKCLDFKTRWVGLAPSPRERDVWVLHVR